MLEKLNEKQVKAARMLANGEGTKTIATELEIHAETLYRWKKIPEFRQLMESIIVDDITEVRWKAGYLVDAACNTLWSVMGDHYAASGARIQQR